jgi:mono/diheme cytochrome c family protein/cytochrome c5
MSDTPMNPATIASGQQIFRFDSYGDESYWTDTLRMHEVIASSVSPATALAVGLKVDMDALPTAVVQAIQQGKVDLNSPATTVALLKLGAVVGIKGTVDATNTLTSVGITCALCHSTVDNAFAPGIGHRLDAWPNRDLNVGAIVALSPNVPASLKAILNTWGPGKYDPRINIDGKNTPLVIPPAFGMRHVARETYTADGVVSYWNDYVAVTQMHGHGSFSDQRIGVNINNPPDLVTSKLEALRAYQFSIEKPEPQAGQVDASAAKRGKQVFMGVGGCASCHYGVALSDINAGVLHSPAEVGQDPAYALRTATKLYRTTPLRGLWNPPQLRGPYFHDGSAATLEQVVDHYVAVFHLSLSTQQKSDLVAYLKTL